MRTRLPLLAAAVLALGGAAAASPQGTTSLSFQDLGLILTAQSLGLPDGSNVRWATGAVLPDGRVRLYYSVDVPNNFQATGIFSAVSTDGVHFVQEPGHRYSFPTRTHIERLPDGRWRLYYEHGPANNSDGVASAISNDGLTFTDEAGLRLANPASGRGLSCCGIYRLADGRYRLYVTSQYYPPNAPPGPAEIYSAVSSDLVGWTLEPGVRTLGVSPVPLSNPDGSVLLALADQFSGILTASSTDGLTFSDPVQTDLTGDFHDPALVPLPDGRLLLYYSTTSQPDRAIASSIGVAVASLVTAPIVTYPSPAATAITASSARISAAVNPSGDGTSYFFEWGTSTHYNDSTGSSDLPAGYAPHSVSTTITGLLPATTYHFRVQAYSSLGTTYGADQIFRTAKCGRQLERDHGFEVALAHARTRAAAAGALRGAAKALHGTPIVEHDCADYESAIAGLTRAGAAKTLGRATRAGFRKATVERT